MQRIHQCSWRILTLIDEIVDIIKEFDNHKSSDIPIALNLIEHCALTIAPILCTL